MPNYGMRTQSHAHASIGGYGVGIIANNGPIFPDSSVKAAQVRFSSAGGRIRLFSFCKNSSTGFMVGVEAERNGIVKHGAKFVKLSLTQPFQS